MQGKLISVILPTYNRMHTLSRAIKSILTQTYSNIELIIVDDASEDKTSELISSIKDKRLIYIRLSENKGPAGARNVGLNLTKGEYITFLDSDDE
jgi:glycosyltransferase involved in cell wall biosynthesis